MLKPKLVDVYVYQETVYDEVEFSFTDLSKLMEEAALKIPEQFKESAKLIIGCEKGYDNDLSMEISIIYSRPENEDELEIRLYAEITATERKEAQERRELAILKKKYENNSDED